MRNAPEGGAGFERLRDTPAGTAGDELRADQAAADTAAEAEAGMVLDMRLSFAGRWRAEARERFGIVAGGLPTRRAV